MRIVHLAIVFGVLTSFACKQRQADRTSSVRDETDPATPTGPRVSDEDIAKLKSIAGTYGCTDCHGDDREQFEDWATSTTNTKVVLDTLGQNRVPSAGEVRGFYRAFPEHFWKRFVAQFPEQATRDARYQSFRRSVVVNQQMQFIKPGMSDAQKTQAYADFDAAIGIFERLAAEKPGAFVTACSTKITPRLKAHVQKMASEGWGTKLLSSGINGQAWQGHRCPAGSVDPTACFTGVAERAELNAAPGTRLVGVVQDFYSEYWVRSSPDGSKIGFGTVDGPGRITDLGTKRVFKLPGYRYDPGFDADGTGFNFHGTKVALCPMTVLNPNRPGVEMQGGWREITVNIDSEPTCLVDNTASTSADYIVTYQSIGNSGANNALVLTGAHSDDIGLTSRIKNDMVSFSGKLTVDVLERRNGRYERVPPRLDFNLPQEGDYSLSPSGIYMAGRWAAAKAPGQPSRQIAYRLRDIDSMVKGTGGDEAANDVSTVCMPGAGGKVLFSYDERFLTFHQYEGNSANVYVADLWQDGKVIKVTQVGQNQLAVYPHFRADGWLYFALKDGQQRTWVLASDVAIKEAIAHPME